MPKKSAIVDGEECTHLISAKITPKAFETYAEWKRMSIGGARISKAIIQTKENAENHALLMKEIRDMQQEMSELKLMLRTAQRERRQYAPLAQELRELYTPQQARLEDFSTNQPPEDE